MIVGIVIVLLSGLADPLGLGRQLVNEIDRKLQLDGARPILGWSTRYIVAWPFIKNLVPHPSLHRNNRMQEVWLDK